MPLTADRMEAFAGLLGHADFGGCFCAVWTHAGPGWGTRCRDAARPNLAATRQDVASGRKPGFLVFEGPELVGWTGAGPRSEFPRLHERLGARLSDRTDAWIVGCFALPAAARGRGLADAILDGVIARARAEGAGCIEAFPTRPWDEPRSYRGSEALFLRHGFEEIGAEADGDSRTVAASGGPGPSLRDRDSQILLMRREL
ncbi:MAG: GNAT family N-acetyltransferase [Myxococcota bacterium]